MPTALDDFHPAVRAWFERRFDAPSRAQELGWPVIGAANEAPGFDVLLCAPTGSGKTLAAFMWAINGLVLDAASHQLRQLGFPALACGSGITPLSTESTTARATAAWAGPNI